MILWMPEWLVWGGKAVLSLFRAVEMGRGPVLKRRNSKASEPSSLEFGEGSATLGSSRRWRVALDIRFAERSSRSTSMNSRSNFSCLVYCSCGKSPEGGGDELLRGESRRSSERRTLCFRSDAVSHWWLFEFEKRQCRHGSIPFRVG